MHIHRNAALAALSATLIGAPLPARDYHRGLVTIQSPWSRATSPRADTGAGFATIRNRGPLPDRLLSATTPIAAEVQFHSMARVGGIMRMRPMPNGLDIPAGRQAVLAPGGNHIMFVGLKRPLRQGEAVPVTLRFARAGTVPVRFRVEGPGAQGPSNDLGERQR